jgi:hypothetical protein
MGSYSGPFDVRPSAVKSCSCRRGSCARGGRCASWSPRRAQGCRAFDEAEYSTSAQITSGIPTSEHITGSRAPAFAPGNRHPISGSCTLTYPTNKPPRSPNAAHPHPAGNPRQAQTRAGPQAAAVAKGVRATGTGPGANVGYCYVPACLIACRGS